MWERGITNLTFQSPRSGQICSNVMNQSESYLVSAQRRFNPLDRVKFVQMIYTRDRNYDFLRFNPLDRVKFVQIA